MNVEMLETVSGRDVYERGEVYEVVDAIAHVWEMRGLCRQTDREPPHVERFKALLDRGAGQRCLFLPHLGEFGHRIMTGIRLVHWNRASVKVVCCRPGEQVLYPSASGFVTDWTPPAHVTDAETAGTMRSPACWWHDIAGRFPYHQIIEQGGLTRAQELLILHPDRKIPFHPRRRGMHATVVFAPRKRDFCPEKNWQHWQRFADALRAEGIDYAVIGDKRTTFNITGAVCHSGDYDTDAAIELLQNCALYVGPDTGSSHLAAAVGARMLIFGLHTEKHRNMVPQMEAMNAGRVAHLLDGWNDPQAVIDAMIKELNAVRA